MKLNEAIRAMIRDMQSEGQTPFELRLHPSTWEAKRGELDDALGFDGETFLGVVIVPDAKCKPGKLSLLDAHAVATWERAEAVRLRALVKAAEWWGNPMRYCPWCEVGWCPGYDKPEHEPTCPAFTPEGDVR